MKYFLQPFFLLWIITIRETRAEKLSCHGGFLDPEHTLNLGQKWGQGIPARTVHIDLFKVTRGEGARSHYRRRQVGVGLTSRLHFPALLFLLPPGAQLLIRNDEHRICLEVDGVEALRIGHVTESVTHNLDTVMRFSVGGILINHTHLMEPLSTPLDGCIRNWIWLSQSPEWLLDPSQLNPPKLCFSSHRRGSYFPGTGRATFKTTDIIPAVAPQDSQWHLSLQMQLHSQTDSFSLLGVSHPDGDHVLTLRGEQKTLVLELGNVTALSLPIPDLEGCSGLQLLLEVTHTSVILQFGEKEEQRPITDEQYTNLRDAWKKGGYLYLGGWPDNYFHGCLQNILIQGANIDLDSALYKSDSISSHSCPLPDKDIK
ncbi:sex hormone-binding globulin-like [Discoglossus pictus]